MTLPSRAPFELNGWATRIGDILGADHPCAVTADIAIRLARFLDTSPEFWLNLQSSNELSVVAAGHGA